MPDPKPHPISRLSFLVRVFTFPLSSLLLGATLASQGPVAPWMWLAIAAYGLLWPHVAYVLSRLTAPGSLYLAVIALIPTLAFVLVGAGQNFPFGGTSILIIVGVGLDTVKKIESQLQQRNYEGFLK